LSQYDKDGDGFLEKEELPQRMLDRFQQMDADGSGKVSLEELRRVAGGNSQPGANGAAAERDSLLGYLDTSGDAELSAEEIAAAAERLGKLDKNEDGRLDRDELASLSRPGGGRNGGKPGEIITPAAKGERITDKLKVGDMAPEFTLPRLSGKGAISLAALHDTKPVVLIFASYT
jgi:Ca2+-binding EF-hand superfamily protein